MNDDRHLYFRLDCEDRIVEVGGAWNGHADEDGAAAIPAGSVVGTSLFQHISGNASRSFVWTALDAVRKLGSTRTFAYRCDSPDCKRHMEMAISPEDNGSLIVEHRLLKVEPLPMRVRFTTTADPRGPLLVRCSMCNRVKLRGDWLEPDQAASTGILAEAASNTVVYGVCNLCRERAGRVLSERS